MKPKTTDRNTPENGNARLYRTAQPVHSALFAQAGSSALCAAFAPIAAFVRFVQTVLLGLFGGRFALIALCCTTYGVIGASNVSAEDFDAEFSLEQHESGGLYLHAEVATGVDAEFLLDTGASMVTVTEEVLSAAKSRGEAHHAGAIAARLANGRLQKMEVWELDHLRLGACDVGPVEVAVVPKGRNILGLNALSRMAPFAIHLSPLKLAVSGCAPAGVSTPIAAAF